MTVRNALLSLLLMGLFVAPGQAFAQHFYLDSKGNDSNACTKEAPCATLDRASTVIANQPSGVYSLQLADGRYRGGLDIYYYRVVTVTGNCNNPLAVYVDPNVPQGSAFYAQDHAILTVSCVAIHSDGGVGIGLAARQFAIMDYWNVAFGNMTIHVAASEKSKINCLGARIFGNAAYHMYAVDQSQISGACAYTLTGGTIGTFALVVNQSEINANVLSYSGAAAAINNKCYHDASSIMMGAANLPGYAGC